MDIAVTTSSIDTYISWLDLAKKKLSESYCISYKTLFEIMDKYKITHMYFGNEFCQYLLPKISNVRIAIKYCEQKGLDFVLITPPLTEYGINICREYLELFMNLKKDFSIVVNDIGLLQLIKEMKYSGKIIFGRIMEKSIHEIRITDLEEKEYYTEIGYKYIHSLAYQSKYFLDFLKENDISRIGYDGNKNVTDLDASNIGIDYYFPTEYLTTGRMCLFRIAGQSEKDKYLLNDKCAHLCQNSMEILTTQISYLKIDESGKRIREMEICRTGNTLFYLHCSVNTAISDRIVLDVESIY